MRVLAVGGAASGKSAWAETKATQLAARRTYVATMRDEGVEAQERIARHVRQRAGAGFATIECPSSLVKAIEARRGGVVLVDDLGNLLANALFAEDGSMAGEQDVLTRLIDEFEQLCAAYKHVVVVGNVVGCEGPWSDEATETWVRLTGSLCCELAARFDLVVEVVSGIACTVKGAAA